MTSGNDKTSGQFLGWQTRRLCWLMIGGAIKRQNSLQLRFHQYCCNFCGHVVRGMNDSLLFPCWYLFYWDASVTRVQSRDVWGVRTWTPEHCSTCEVNSSWRPSSHAHFLLFLSQQVLFYSSFFLYEQIQFFTKLHKDAFVVAIVVILRQTLCRGFYSS